MAYTNTYQRINWQNLPSEATALNDVNLNKMDAEIYAHGEQFETVDTALGHKVDKESGKGLSAIKTLSISTSANTGTEIASISYKDQNNLTVGYTIKNGVVVDSALSSSSENPVQNKVVKSAVDAKSTVSISDTLVTGDTIANLTINGTTTAIKAPLVEVDDTPSATSENPLQNKAIYEMLNNLLPEETVQGNPIAISDASGLNAKACSVDLLPIQDLSHGDPSPTNICPISGRTEVNLTVADAETSPTQTETYTETLGQTVYGGKVDFVSGKLTIEYEYKKITRTAESYTYSGMNGVSFASTLDGSKTRSVGYCSHAKVVTDTSDTQEGDMWFGVGNARVYWVGILDAMQMTLAEFQTYMSNNDVYIAYPLNTPTEITLTAEQIALLKGNNVVSTDGDNIKLVYSADIGLYIAGQLQNS